MKGFFLCPNSEVIITEIKYTTSWFKNMTPLFKYTTSWFKNMTPLFKWTPLIVKKNFWKIYVFMKYEYWFRKV